MKAFYSFLPYIRNGLNNFLTQVDSPTGSSPSQRTNLKLKIGLTADKVQGGTQDSTVEKDFALKGPGDVTGINKNSIVKIHPENWVTNFEPNYLPFIEFYDEDFCWRYTPATYRNDGNSSQYKYRLRPWMTLVVLMDDEFELIQTPDGKQAIKTKKTANIIFPKQESLWAWAHVHVNENLAEGEDPIGNTDQNITKAINKLKNSVLKQTPDKVVSRLVSSRRLLPNTGYTAFLIPTFETGRRAGLGLEPFNGTQVQMLQGAWNAQTPAGTEYPIYHQWYFKTGGAGDFESLVRLLQPRVLNQTVGKRLMDLQKSNNPLLEAINPPRPTINLQGIAQPIDSIADSWSLSETNPYTKEIRKIINKPATILDQVEMADPIIAPPIYGKWHAVQDSVPEVPTAGPNWMQEVNLDPRFRVFAGAGVETIRRNQEEYMNIAWEQIGEVMEANRKLLYLQLTRQANLAIYNRHLKTLNNELLLNISSPAHQRMINNNKQFTLFKEVDNSRIPVSMLSGAYRRLTRANSTLMKGIALTNSSLNTTAILSDINSGTTQIITPYQPPAGQVSYNIWEPDQLTYEFTMSLPQNAGFQFSDPGVIASSPYPGNLTPPVQAMVESIASLHGMIENLPDYYFELKPSLSLANSRSTILSRTEPKANALAIANNFIQLHNVKGQALQLLNTNYIMAAPKIKIPMYEELAKLSPDWIMPGLGDIEMNSINMLQVNQKYLESYMLGLNYEMGRELMWRGFPTDQRGTYFSFFWGYNDSIQNLIVDNESEQIFNLDNYRDIEDIHKWRITPNLITSPLKKLGTNSARTAGPSLLVLTIRGELLRKYPGTVIYLQKAKFLDTNQPRESIEGTEVYPVFSGKVEPDIYLLGFPIDAATIRGTGYGANKDPGYFVVFQERSTEVRFGADEASLVSPPSIVSWDDLSWGNLKANPSLDGFIDVDRTITVSDANNPDKVDWNWNSATVAYALHQSPVKLNVHAEGLIPKPNQ